MNGKRYGRGLIAAFSALVAVVAIILAVFVISGDEADLSYRSVDFDARLQSNGDIRFTEHLDYQLKRREDGNGDTKPWKQLYLTFKLRNQDLTNITDISVTNASTGEEYTQTDPQLPSGISDGTWDSDLCRPLVHRRHHGRFRLAAAVRSHYRRHRPEWFRRAEEHRDRLEHPRHRQTEQPQVRCEHDVP